MPSDAMGQPASVVDAEVEADTLDGGPGSPAAVDAGAGSMDATVPAPAPTVAMPCGDDLTVDLGRVVVDFGVPQGSRFEGDPGAAGPYGVERLDTSFDNPDPTRPDIEGSFYLPSSDDATSGGPGSLPERLPLVLVMHGFGGNHLAYNHFSEHLASHGLLPFGITLPFSLVAAHDKNADEALAAIDFAFSAGVPSPVLGRVDGARVAVAGHSFGGKIGFSAAARDPRIKIVIGWDPSNAGGAPCFVDPGGCHNFAIAPNCAADDPGVLHGLRAEALVFRAAPDGTNPEPDHNAIHFFRGAPAPATMLDYDANAAHAAWIDPGGSVVAHTKRVQLALLLTRFMGATGLEAWLPGGMQTEQGPGVVRVLRK